MRNNIQKIQIFNLMKKNEPLIEYLCEDLNDEQKDIFKSWFLKAYDHYNNKYEEIPEISNIVLVIICRLIKRNYDFVNFDFDDVEKQYNYFFDNLQGSKFEDIECEAVAMTTSYFMEKSFNK
jgi:hypothetical protein